MNGDSNSEKKMTERAPMYLWATEMVGEYYRALDISGKKVLTIAGSGDQILDAVFFGADVTGFDINRHALFMTELKQAAIGTLSYGEFLQFFQNNKNGFAELLYRRFTNALLADTKAFFDAAYEEVGSCGLGMSGYFRKRDAFAEFDRLKRINPYLRDEAAYLSLREKLSRKKPELFVGDVLVLKENASISVKKYDVINLSNVPNYLTGKSFGKTEEAVLMFLEGLMELLISNGVAFFYSYDNRIYPNPISPTIPPISCPEFFEKLRGSKIFFVEQQEVAGMLEGQRDRITICKKKE